MNAERNARKNIRVDPDPYAITTIALMSASLLLQFVQVFRDSKGVSSKKQGHSARYDRLSHLLDELSNFQTLLDRCKRALVSGSENPEQEFLQARYGIAVSTAYLSKEHFREYNRHFVNLAQKIGAISVWIHNIIDSDPDLASSIGGKILRDFEGLADELNFQMAEGGPNQEILVRVDTLLKFVLQILEREAADLGGN